MDQIQVTVEILMCLITDQEAEIYFTMSLVFSTGLSRGQNPHVYYWKQGGPARAASRGKLCEQFTWREVGQGV